MSNPSAAATFFEPNDVKWVLNSTTSGRFRRTARQRRMGVMSESNRQAASTRATGVVLSHVRDELRTTGLLPGSASHPSAESGSTIEFGLGDIDVGPGSVLFVAKDKDHRFVDLLRADDAKPARDILIARAEAMRNA